MESSKKYCMCCDEEVSYHSIVRDGKREVACAYCGFVMDVVQDDEGVTRVNCIVTADDNALIRELLRTELLKNGLASEVQAFPDGQQAVALISKRFSEGRPVDCVILDLEMPVMSGIAAARVIRSLEERFNVSPTPLIFFSVRSCNEDLKKQLALLSPASYINKGNGGQLEQLLKRINQLIVYLLRKRQQT